MGEPEDICALLSCLVFTRDGGGPDGVELPESLKENLAKAQKIAANLLDLQLKHGCDIDEREHNVDNFKTGLVHVVREWALGKSFNSIMQLIDQQEGIIVRCISRLNDACRDVGKAARVIGDADLFEK